MTVHSQTSFSSSTTSSNSTDAATALHILLSPDGYYTYLGISKKSSTGPTTTGSTATGQPQQQQHSLEETDKALIQKNYRRLSLRLHPDRPTGDQEAFRVLERAKHVLLSDKLRKQYDLLGLDLEDDDYHDESHQEDEYGNTVDDLKKNDDASRDGVDYGTSSSSGSTSGTSGSGSSGAKDDKSNGVLSHMASATVAALLQLAVRTGMMAIASVIVTRWKYTTIPAVLFLLYTSFQIYKAKKSCSTNINHADVSHPPTITTYDVLSPILIAVGIMMMYSSKTNAWQGQEEGNASFQWNKLFWMGETLVMSMFCINTLVSKEASVVRPSLGLGVGVYIFFGLIALYIRGKGWRYMTILSVELVCALVAVMVFPIMEMIMEALVDEKMKKVGEKVRLYAKVMEEHHKRELEELERKLRISSHDGDHGGRGSSRKGTADHPEELD